MCSRLMNSMSRMRDQQYLVDEQYRDASNLNARGDVHARFSTNKYPWFLWVFDHLRLPEQARVLEVGSGPGTLWLDNARRIPAGWEVTLSDLSPGMLDEARRNLHDIGRPFDYAVVDAQAIPFPDGSFDASIANHMLYHAPDPRLTLAEVRRALQPGGRFYAATNGPAHLRELNEFLPGPAADLPYGGEYSFGLDNGRDLLASPFAHVTLHRRDDALAVTEVAPVVAFILSSPKELGLDDEGRAEVAARVERELATRGVIRLTKDTGLFEAWGER